MNLEKHATVSNKFIIEILRLTKEAQQQHGLRHGDFQRYRGYCSRRLKRLRKALKLPQGDKKHFKKREVVLSNFHAENLDQRLIYIPLMMTERSWSYAMQLKQESNTEPRKKFHLINKLRKACLYSLQLQNLCNADVFDARTKLEAEAYVAWMHGTLHFELSLWKTAAESLKKAQVIYENLALTLDEEERNLYNNKANEQTPSLRYCAYNVGDGASIDDLFELRARGLLENFDILVAQTKIQSSEAMQTIEWSGRKVAVRPERVRMFLLSLQEFDKSLEKAKNLDSKIEMIENVIMDCKDAILAVKDEIKQDPKFRPVGLGQSVSGIQYLLAYLSNIRLMRTLQRNMCLVDQAKANLDHPNAKSMDGKRVRPQDLTRLYEIMLQNISEIQQINGVEEDFRYQTEIQNINVAFQAFRCYYIALTLVEMKRWKEAVAMYERSKKHASNVLNLDLNLFDLSKDLTKLIATINGCMYSAHAYSVLENDISDEIIHTSRSQKSSKSLPERISYYKEEHSLNSKNPNVYRLTPEMQPISCKPLFFDLAFNYIELPSIENKSDSSSIKRHGISGFVKGFLGWAAKN